MNHALLLRSVEQLSRYGRLKDLPVLDQAQAFADKYQDGALANATRKASERLRELEHVNVAFVQLEGGQTSGSGVKSYVNPTSEALANLGHRVDVYLPMTGELDPLAKGLVRVEGSEGTIVDVKGNVRHFELWTEPDSKDRPNGGRRNVYYIKDDHYFTPRTGMYDEAPGKRFDDDPERLMAGAAYVNAAMSKVAALRKVQSEGGAVTAESVQAAEKRLSKSDVPDVIQYNDSHFGFSHAMLQFNEAFKDTQPLGIVHQGNPAYRRWIPREYVEPMLRSLGGEYEKALEALGDHEWVDPLEMMANTMTLSTVSTGYLDYLLHDFTASPRVMMTLQEAHAEGRLSAVQNGIDLEKFDPAVSHPSQAAAFSADDLSGRVENKLALQKEWGLTVDAEAPLLAFAHRMTLEKGLQNLLGDVQSTGDAGTLGTPLDVVLRENPRLQILLGGPDPDPALLDLAHALAERWPGRVVVKGERLDNRKIMSATDVFLMPSVEEPCGIAQMEAQALCAAVLYHNHQGPKGSVVPYEEGARTGTGFPVVPGSSEALIDGLREAVAWASMPAEAKAPLQRNAIEYAKTFDIRRVAENQAALLREARTFSGKDWESVMP
jgi:glycogen synthase